MRQHKIGPLVLDNYDSREPWYEPPHELRWQRHRLATITIGPVRFGASLSSLIGARAYIRAGSVVLRTTIGRGASW